MEAQEAQEYRAWDAQQVRPPSLKTRRGLLAAFRLGIFVFGLFFEFVHHPY